MVDSSKQINTSAPKTMAELLRSAKAQFISPKKGEVISGTITKLSPVEILVDIKAKTEATVLEKDKKILRSLLSSLKVGDKVNVSVLNPESESGNPVVSLRRFIDDLTWKKIEESKKTQEPFEALVKESTKGGFILETSSGMQGFLPNSQMSQDENSQNIVGKKITVYALDLDRELKKVIFSQKKTITKEEFEQATKNLKPGQRIEAVVGNVTPFGIFVNLQNLTNGVPVDGLVHISELSWEKVEDVSQLFKQGEKIQAEIIGFDEDTKRINLSIKRLSKDPFEELFEGLSVDQKVSGTVSKITSNGLNIAIKGKDKDFSQIDALIKKEKIPPTVTYNVGDEITATISSIDKGKHRVILVPVLQAKPIGYR